MATSINMGYSGYVDAYGRPIGNDVNKWFKNGVRPVGIDTSRKPCSHLTVCYIFLGITCFILIFAAIIVPLVISSINKNNN
ncbi:unnamed protein product [Adineta steineri]|uniref:Uncharacterized protein n=2 Tax=Adineta steineri TaxID=433720 RepID=A0A814A3A1_9BILA|nr:unnamed protein product [Adineta steineri]CAF4261345.1 unnamed protein product [Adineta steineri]